MSDAGEIKGGGLAAAYELGVKMLAEDLVDVEESMKLTEEDAEARVRRLVSDAFEQGAIFALRQKVLDLESQVAYLLSIHAPMPKKAP